MNWTDRLTAWFEKDRNRGFFVIKPHLMMQDLRMKLSNRQFSDRCACGGGVVYTLSNGLTIFAETLSRWGL